MALIQPTSRARGIMDLIKDGEVATLAAYAAVELLGAAEALKYAQAFWDAYPTPDLFEPDGVTPRSPTNDELAVNYINRLRQYHKEILRAQRTKAAAEAARTAEATTVDAEMDSDLSTDEPVDQS